MSIVKSYIEARDNAGAARERFFESHSDEDMLEFKKEQERVDILRKPITGLIHYAWIVYYELHVDDQTFCVHKIVYADTQAEAREEFDKLESQHGEHYHLQLKGGPFRLTEEYWLMEEI